MTRWLLTRAVGGADRMESLIDDLLAFARLGGRLARVPVDLETVVRESAEDLAPTLDGAALDGGSAADGRRRPRAAARGAAEPGGERRQVHPAGMRRGIEVSSSRTGSGWRVEIVDHGIGVPPEHRDRVFEPLVRVETNVPGSGIGLATVRRIIEAHGGRIGLDETAGGGTTVWFELPD